MAVQPNKWPPELTNNRWQKQKGLLAKGSGKTGVGEAMAAAERAWKQVKLEQLNVNRAVTPTDRKDPAKIATAKVAAEQHYRATVLPLREKLAGLIVKADEWAGTWGRNKLMPASARRCAEEVSSVAHDFLDLFDRSQGFMKANLESFDEMLASMQKLAEDKARETEAEIAGSIAALEKGLAEFKTSPSLDSWATNCRQQCRNMANATHNNPKLEKFANDWAHAGTDAYIEKCPANDPAALIEFFKPRVKAIARDLDKIKKGYKAALKT